MLFTCIKSWFFRSHLANFNQISHWSFCWNVIDSLFKWSCSIDCQAHIFFFKTKNCSNDNIFISCNDRINIIYQLIKSRPRWLSWMRQPTEDQEVASSTSAEVCNILSWRMIEIFSTVILSFPLIQEGQLSVSGERMCTILVNCLED